MRKWNGTSERGYEKTVADTKLAVDTMVDEAIRLTLEFKRLTKELAAEDEDEDAREALKRTTDLLTKMKTDNVTLQKFRNTIDTQWNVLENRTVGHTDWTPAISYTVDATHHTRDIGVFELDGNDDNLCQFCPPWNITYAMLARIIFRNRRDGQTSDIFLYIYLCSKVQL